jgi:hypothetical protein
MEQGRIFLPITMMGMIKSVQEIIETVPGIQSHNGPHGITIIATRKK